MADLVSSERLSGIVALYREQADAVPEQYPSEAGDLSQHVEAREDLSIALRVGALLLEEVRSPMTEQELRAFLDVFSLGVERIAELIDPVLRHPERHWDHLAD